MSSQWMGMADTVDWLSQFHFHPPPCLQGYKSYSSVCQPFCQPGVALQHSASQRDMGVWLTSFRTGAGHAGKPSLVFGGLGLWATGYEPDLWGKEELEAEFSHVASEPVNHVYITNSCINSGYSKLQWVPWLVTHSEGPGGWCLPRTQKLCVWDPPRPCLMGLWLVLICICLLW